MEAWQQGSRTREAGKTSHALLPARYAGFISVSDRSIFGSAARNAGAAFPSLPLTFRRAFLMPDSCQRHAVL